MLHREDVRTSTGISEFDRVLGGGLVEGAVVLIGGDPGIGKSTLLLQALASMAGRLPALYVTGEESLAQVAGRASRLGLPLDGLSALAETGVERILEQAVQTQPKLLVADSVQTLWTESLTVSNTGRSKCIVPPFPGVMPPTSGVPYSIICEAWKLPSLPVKPCTINRVCLPTKTLISAELGEALKIRNCCQLSVVRCRWNRPSVYGLRPTVYVS